MGFVTLHPETITAINREFIDSIKREGLVLVSAADAELLIVLAKERKRLLKGKYVSTHQIEKYALLDGVKTRQTVVNMIKDGRISVNEWLPDAKDNYKILTTAIHRLNGE